MPASAPTSILPPSTTVQPDWERVQRAVYHVRQIYAYTYSGPVRDVHQRLIMVPPDRHADQLLISHHTEVRGSTGPVDLRWTTDSFGNRLCNVHLERVEHAVEFEADYRVERTTSGFRSEPSPPSVAERWGAPAGLLRPTALTAPDNHLRAAAAEVMAASPVPLDRADLAHGWAASAIAYKFGVTGVQTPAAMALHLGRGVCQDYAHILLCVLRLVGIPARYVSGHLLGEGAPHAWVEALIEDPGKPGSTQIVSYDPTHHRRVGLNYVTVAVGRDFADVTPTSGLYSGAASGFLSWSKRAEIVEVHHGVDPDQDEVAA